MQTCSVVRRSAPAPLCVTQTYCSAGPTNTLPIVSPTCLLTHPPTHLPTHPPTDAGLLLSSRGGLFRRQRGGVGTTGTARARGELRGRPTPDLTLLTTHYSLLTTHYSLLTTHYSPLTTHHSPLTTHHSLHTTHYARLTTHHSRPPFLPGALPTAARVAQDGRAHQGVLMHEHQRPRHMLRRARWLGPAVRTCGAPLLKCAGHPRLPRRRHRRLRRPPRPNRRVPAARRRARRGATARHPRQPGCLLVAHRSARVLRRDRRRHHRGPRGLRLRALRDHLPKRAPVRGAAAATHTHAHALHYALNYALLTHH